MIATEEAQLPHRLLLHVRSAVADGRLPTTDKPVGSLQALLLEYRSSDEPHVAEAAEAIASCRFRIASPLGRPGRRRTGGSVAAHANLFYGAVRGKHEQPGWKQHLFQTLGKRVGQADLRPPKCDGCGDYDLCFGPADPPS